MPIITCIEKTPLVVVFIILLSSFLHYPVYGQFVCS